MLLWKVSFFPLVIHPDIFLNILHFPLPISFDSALLGWMFTTPTQGEGELGEGENAIGEPGDYYLI